MTAPAGARSGPARVLLVCTGNICRSPLAERLLAAELATRLGPDAAGDVTLGGAGTLGRAGAPMEPAAAAVLRERGADPDGFGARPLHADLVREADLVLGAERAHRAAVVTLLPRASARTFTVREFARLCAAVDPDDLPDGGVAARLRALVRAAASRRGLVPLPEDPGDDDVPDPLGAPVEVFRATADLLQEALRVPLDLLVPTAGGARTAP